MKIETPEGGLLAALMGEITPLQEVCEYFQVLTGRVLNEKGREQAEKLLNSYDLDVIKSCMKKAAAYHLKVDGTGSFLVESVEKMWGAARGKCKWQQVFKDDPEFLVCCQVLDPLGIRYESDKKPLRDLIKIAYRGGSSVEELRVIARDSAKAWETDRTDRSKAEIFESKIKKLIKSRKEPAGDPEAVV